VALLEPGEPFDVHARRAGHLFVERLALDAHQPGEDRFPFVEAHPPLAVGAGEPLRRPEEERPGIPIVLQHRQAVQPACRLAGRNGDRPALGGADHHETGPQHEARLTV